MTRPQEIMEQLTGWVGGQMPPSTHAGGGVAAAVSLLTLAAFFATVLTGSGASGTSNPETSLSVTNVSSGDGS